MSSYVHPRLKSAFLFAEVLEELARELAREARKSAASKQARPRRSATLRPGEATPLWNALVTMVKPGLGRRGARAILARELGVHRARIGEFFDHKTAMPDAERTLHLLVLLSRRAHSGQDGERETQSS